MLKHKEEEDRKRAIEEAALKLKEEEERKRREEEAAKKAALSSKPFAMSSRKPAQPSQIGGALQKSIDTTI